MSALSVLAAGTVAMAAPGAVEPSRPAQPLSSTCPHGDGVVRTMRIHYTNFPTISAHSHDTIRVVAYFPGERAGFASPVSHKRGVCRLSGRRVSRSKTITRWRAVRDRKVEFAATSHARGSNGLPIHVGWVVISK
jgi:hypothetical protein